MICPDCYGKGGHLPYEPALYNLACITCHGYGYVHCCEGDLPQPEPSALPSQNLLDLTEPEAII